MPMRQSWVVAADIRLYLMNSAVSLLLLHLDYKWASIQQFLGLRINPYPPKTVYTAQEIIPPFPPPTLQITF